MRAIEIGRRMAQLGHPEEACGAFALALTKERDQTAPVERMEASVFLFQNDGDYRTAYDGFLDLYREGRFRDEILPILTEAFYLPNADEQRERYRRNTEALRAYPYLFRDGAPDLEAFEAFEDLPLRFYPFDDDAWIPFDTREGTFLEKWRPRYEVISRHFFKDLTDPVLAADVWSQYELEYLRDNVRRSEDVGRENHIYLHYTDWGAFCSALTVLDLPPLLESEKFVFLIGDQIGQYPIDFKARFGIDYGQYPVRPVGIREVTKLIWHTQLSAHNGGDFFNEIFDFHPNLLFCTSIFLKIVQDEVSAIREALSVVRSLEDLQTEILDHWKDPRLVAELYHLEDPTDKDLLVAYYMGTKQWNPNRDLSSRIAPALFFQPHFPRIPFELSINEQGDTVVHSGKLEDLRSSPLFAGFRYIKTFTPIRRFTTSCGGAVRFYLNGLRENVEEARRGDFEQLYKDQELDTARYEGWEDRSPEERAALVRTDPALPRIRDLVSQWALSRGFLTDPADRLFRDSVVVRFEDGKLAPEATFSRLAAFLDLPYADTMRYCSASGKRDPKSRFEGTASGFDTRSVYTTQEGYLDDDTRRYLEYLLRDAYRAYGYDPQWWDGEPADLETVERWGRGSGLVRDWMRTAQEGFDEIYRLRIGFDPLTAEQWEALIREMLDEVSRQRDRAAMGLTEDLRFVSQDGVPLVYCPRLTPDPDLLDGPLYH